MLKQFHPLLFLLILFCGHAVGAQVAETTAPLLYDQSKSTIRKRFTPPKGYAWVNEVPGSFSEYLVNFPLHPPNFPIRDYRAVPIEKQSFHVAILKIDVGDRDLQQCADAWMRLYAEYLWSQKRYDEIAFEFTSGQLFTWNDYKNGVRTKEYKNRVRFYKTGIVDDSYSNFRRYLVVIFRYAGTISLDRESVSVLNNKEIKTGDFLIKPGSPGHSVIVVGVAKNAAGKRLYLLAESFMPAQDIHILRNPSNIKLTPWYEIDINSPQTYTAKYIFKPTSVKRFHAIADKEKENP
ncbi:DUF4846 domain-containing protein [Kaistella palustris]|uniref:DUF4846 domain-containing protein n=1 Tax=Kaistella palustris TaxID=493376 RepID=UPI0003FF7A0A|nr:DUF4846 domain-containing protein [Kaistella palustris]